MSDLISRQDAIDAVLELSDKLANEMLFIDAIIDEIENLPSAEPERKKGRWIKVGHWGRSYKCNQCGNYLDFDGVNASRGDANFCPNCGADMRGGDE